jgi:hypothetical protein
VPNTKQGVTGLLAFVGALAVLGSFLIRDTTGANLELVPVFVGAAVAAVAVRLFLHRSGSRRS